MAATAKITLKVEVEGLGLVEYKLPTKFTHSQTPAEVFPGRATIGSSACNLNLGTITDTDLLGVLLVATGTADTDYVGFLVDDDGASTPSTAAGNQTLNAGEGTYINLGGSTQGLTSGKYIRVKGSAATTGIEYLAFGK